MGRLSRLAPVTALVSLAVAGTGQLLFGQESRPSSPGAQLVVEKCLQCHDRGVVSDSAGFSSQIWGRILTDMEALGMEVSPSERDLLLEYLTTLEPDRQRPLAAHPSPAGKAAESGEVYLQYCQACHGADGRGQGDSLPPLANNRVLPRAPEYVAAVILFGLQGEFQSQGRTFTGVMPAQPALSDKAIASVVNYLLVSWGNDRFLKPDFKPLTAGVVSRLRQSPKDPITVLGMRPEE